MEPETRDTILGGLGIVAAVCAAFFAQQCTVNIQNNAVRTETVRRQAEALEKTALYDALSRATTPSPERQKLVELLKEQVESKPDAN